ncbi:carboxylesterase family protein [Cyanobium sp. Maggiore-St4-Cus]|nr:carboxylesterase family protein [Cyanobium sp. Maggiore-St4-Cus]
MEPLLNQPAKVRIEQGWLRGVRHHDVMEFRGIPYAASTAADKRWTLPVPAKGWSGLRDASAFGPACPQEARFNLTEASNAEDCLSINVSVPQQRPAGRRLPVLVWIHGGAFVGGGSNLYRLDALARQGVVVVSFNYRLGVLGFMPHPAFDSATNGNLGLVDQREALRWVQRNIAAFGGDPTNVTLGGESAGAGSTCMHLAAPELSRGLFHKALVISGGCLVSLPSVQTYEQEVGLPIAARLGCDKVGDALACLRRIQVQRLVQVGGEVTAGKTMSFGPSIGAAQATPRTVRDALRKGQVMKVPLLMGGARDELRLYVGYDQQSQDPARVVTAENYKQRLIGTYGYTPDQINEDRPQQILARFPLQDPQRAPEQVGSVMSHYNPAVGINNCLYLHTASAFRRFAKVPIYQFEFADPKALVLGVGIAAQPNPGMEFGAVHSAALNYLFPNLSNTKRIDAPGLPADSQLLAGQMQGMVTSFATQGVPLAKGLPAWPVYNSGKNDVMLLVPKRSALHDADAAHFCGFWRELYPEFLASP